MKSRSEVDAALEIISINLNFGGLGSSDFGDMINALQKIAKSHPGYREEDIKKYLFCAHYHRGARFEDEGRMRNAAVDYQVALKFLPKKFTDIEKSLEERIRVTSEGQQREPQFFTDKPPSKKEIAERGIIKPKAMKAQDPFEKLVQELRSFGTKQTFNKQ